MTETIEAPTTNLEAARVARGAARLDAMGHRNWFRHVDLTALDIASINRCVLAQLYGSYSKGLSELNLRGYCDCGNHDATDARDTDVDHGFDVCHDGSWHGDAFSRLDAAWRDEVTRRLRAAETAAP